MEGLEKERGFTLIELLVVIAIIGILAGIVLASLGSSRASARDARRIADLQQARTALTLYALKYDNYMESGSGCGYQGNGWGWFNYQGSSPSYPESMSQCLVDAGVVAAEIVDPTGNRSGCNSSNSVYGCYMKSTCAGTYGGTYLYAKLETKPQSSSATDATCDPTFDTLYGMNYVLKVN